VVSAQQRLSFISTKNNSSLERRIVMMANDLHLVTFRVGSELFGVPIAMVQEIVRIPAIASIPHAPEFVEGVINLRGKVIAVIDMRKRLRAAIKTSSTDANELKQRKKSRILVVESGNRLVGVIVDEVKEVLKLGEDRVEPAPSMVGNISGQYIDGIGKLSNDLLILIDMGKILTAEQIACLSEQLPSAA
jgi:purine-binding chemotaxis protein CheW